MRQDLPQGAATLLFTDIEGSTALLDELGAETYGELLSQHHRVCRVAWVAHGGVEVDTAGDAFFIAFPTASEALAAAREAQVALSELGLRVRMGVHTGEVTLGETGYVGFEVHRAARIAAAAHGGQVVLSSATAALVARDGLVDLGEHRFKDVAEPVAIFQLGDGSFPPLKSISNTNLPRPTSSFVGRDRELAELLARIENGARLVTLTGPGGSGKTRLALEAAGTLVPEYKAGVFWVGLAALRDPALVLESIAHPLGAKDDLAGHIGERELLLLLDNLEQVIDAAAELSGLLRACPNLRLLVTSRELLRIDGEVEYAVPPLAEPEAVALFCERAQTDATDEIAELCTRLDNLPLAVELAAARTKVLSPAQILERLSQRLDLLKGGRDADLRQQTLRATIAWSYDLLPPEEREPFERLSVFASGCSYSAAEIVAECNVDTLQSLIDKSLVRRRDTAGGPRYLQLETIRQYAAEKLDDHQESSALRDRHLDWIVDHVTANAPVWVRPADPARVGALFEEEREILAAIAWAVTRPDADRALELCGRMGRAWVETGRWGSGLSVTLAALSLCTGDPELVARAQLTAGVLGSHGGSPGGDEQIRTARELFNDHGLAWEAAVAGMILGSRSTVNGNVDTGIALLEQSVAEFETLADREGQRVARGSLADAVSRRAATTDELRRAVTLINETLELDRAAGDPYDEIAGLANLCEVLIKLGEPAEARSTALQAAAVMHTIGANRALADLAISLADASLAVGRHDEALLLATAVEPISNELGQHLMPRDRERISTTITLSARSLDSRSRNSAVERGSVMSGVTLLDYLVALTR